MDMTFCMNRVYKH